MIMTKYVFTCLAGLLLAAAPALAQSSAPVAALAGADYTGPRFPGGPDSLRALVQRATRPASPAVLGKMVVRFELKDGRQPQNFKLLMPPGRVSKELKTAAVMAAGYLQANMPAWEPGQVGSNPDAGSRPDPNPPYCLPLSFMAAPAPAQPYAYADQNPVFLAILTRMRAQPNGYAARWLADEAQAKSLSSTPKGLSAYIQMQVRYPAEALRQRQQGQVYVYFEVSETGAIEQPQIVGTAGGALDEEVLRVVRELPAATTPAMLRGKPVRIFYLLPVTFKMV